MSFGPKKPDFQDILISSLGALLTGMIGSVLIIIIAFFLQTSLDIQSNFAGIKDASKQSATFPLILAAITVLGITISSFGTYYILTITNPEKYKKSGIIYGQIALLQTIVFICLCPIYIYTGAIDYDNILIVYLVHVLILVFGINIIIDTLNNYRYILVGLYGSFLGLYVSSVITLIIFNSMERGIAKLIILVCLLPLINFLSVFFKQLFELMYYQYYKLTNMDQIGDIFFQIELEEKEQLKELEEKNTI